MSDEPTFFELAERLDRLIPLEAPRSEQVEEALNLIADEALEQYFFKHLTEIENPAWFESLRQHGFFDAPPEPVECEGTVIYPRWPVSWYLAGIAPKLPEAVVEIAERIRTQDLLVLLNLVRAAGRMPPAHAAQMVPLILRWAGEGMKIEDDVISLATHLAKGEEWEAALTLIGLILSPKELEVSEESRQSPFFSPRAVTRAEKYFVGEFVERGLAFFLEQRPLEVLGIVEENLERALEIENRDAATDSSSGWRPAIEPHEQNWAFGDIKDLLVDAVLRALGYVIENVPDQGRAIVETYLEHRYSIFRRLAIHSIRMNATLWPDLVERLFTDERYLDDKENYQVYHEYWALMHEAYDSLPTPVQDAFVERLLEKLPQDDEREQVLYHPQRHAVLRRLWAIKDSLRLDKHRHALTGLVSEYGEPEHPAFLSYSRTLTGRASPKTSQDLVSMSHEEILAELRKELPFESFDGPSQEGLADALKTAIISSPGHFASVAPQLFGPDIPSVYTYHALWGFRKAWKESEFNWNPVLELCDQVSQTREQESDNGEPPDMVPGYWMMTYASARGAVADLIEVGVVRDEKAIPSDLLPRVRDILLVLADDPNPSPEYEQERIATEVPFGVLTIALNVTRGKAVEALLQYALHVARARSQEQEQAPQPSSRMEDEVRSKLTEKLSKQIDPSLAVHSLFGKYLPNLYYLDREWLTSNLERIFPRQPEMADYWEAAWDGYMFRSDFFGDLYEGVLRPYYRYALEQIAQGEQGRAGSEASRGRLAHHLAVLYWRGIEALDDDSLVALFFDSVSDELRASFVGSLGGALREAKPDANSEEWLRMRTLWETRFRTVGEKVVELEEPVTEHTAELGAFVGWVPFIPEDLSNFYPMIRIAALASDEGEINRLIEFLASVAVEHASFTVSLMGELLKQDGRSLWFLRAGHTAGHVKSILEAAMKSGDDQSRSHAVTVINLFGRRGDERYKDLLELE